MSKSEPILSWREKCIDKFKLKPVPTTWAAEVAAGSEQAWQRYFEFRSNEISSDNDDNPPEEDYAVFMQEWRHELDNLCQETFGEDRENGWKWSCSPFIGDLCVDDGAIRTALLGCYVWSPYAIPHFLCLGHHYHQRARYSTFEFSCDWTFQLMDTEETIEINADDDEELCSCHIEDERLRAHVIQTSRLDDKRCTDRLRRFLFGSHSDASKQETCTDFEFLTLLFGSMGTFNYKTIWASAEGPGWEWSPRIYLYGRNNDKNIIQRMVDDKLLRPGKHCATDAYGIQVTWLEYHIRKASNSLRPIDQYYRPPRLQDAAGYDSEDSGEY